MREHLLAVWRQYPTCYQNQKNLPIEGGEVWQICIDMLPFAPRFGQTFSLRIDPLSLVGAAPACLQAVAKGEGFPFLLKFGGFYLEDHPS